jgi:DNA-binding FadR family transcriptional regulator
MAELYQVSRTVIREAMKVLKEKGWIQTRVAKGTFVVDNVAKTVRDSFDAVVRMDKARGFRYLIEVREILEPEVAALAASRADEIQRDRLRQAVGSMDHALKQGDKSEEFLSADFTFHMLLAESTNNPLIPMILSPLFKLLREQQAYYSSNVKEGPSRSQVNHMKIMEAISNRDPDAARSHMIEHIHQVRMDIDIERSSLRENDPFSLSAKERSG